MGRKTSVASCHTRVCVFVSVCLSLCEVGHWLWFIIRKPLFSLRGGWADVHGADREAHCEGAAAFLAGNNPETPSLGRPEGCLCNLRSARIDRHEKN